MFNSDAVNFNSSRFSRSPQPFYKTFIIDYYCSLKYLFIFDQMLIQIILRDSSSLKEIFFDYSTFK